MKIALGIINNSDSNTYNKCINNLPAVDSLYTIHNTQDIPNTAKQCDIYKNYISYGGLYNIILRKFYNTDIDVIFTILSSCTIIDHTVLQDYINVYKNFGTKFMTSGSKEYKNILVEDDKSLLNLCLYEKCNIHFSFMLKDTIHECGMYDEGFTNFNQDIYNNLEMYDYYHTLEKFNYLPAGYYPDVDLSFLKIKNNTDNICRPNLPNKTTDLHAQTHGKFYYKNKFIIDKHKTVSQQNALKILENLQAKHHNYEQNI